MNSIRLLADLIGGASAARKIQIPKKIRLGTRQGCVLGELRRLHNSDPSKDGPIARRTWGHPRIIEAASWQQLSAWL